MDSQKIMQCWRRSDQENIRIWHKRARSHLPGILRYWRLHERTYKTWLDHELPQLTRELFAEAFRSFALRVRIVKFYLAQVSSALSQTGFWEALFEDTEAAAGMVVKPSNKKMVADVLGSLGFLGPQVILLRSILPNDVDVSSANEVLTKRGLGPPLALLRGLVLD